MWDAKRERFRFKLQRESRTRLGAFRQTQEASGAFPGFGRPFALGALALFTGSQTGCSDDPMPGTSLQVPRCTPKVLSRLWIARDVLNIA